MVRQVGSLKAEDRRTKGTPGWKAALAVLVAGGGLLWHLLACVESPMAWSADGRHLAFVTCEPVGKADDVLSDPAPGERTYRVFVLTEGRDLSVLDESKNQVFSGPAVSPDGRHVAYVRVAIPAQPIKHPDEDDKPPASQAATAPEDVSLPRVELLARLDQRLKAAPALAAELVVRELAGGKLVQTLDLPLVHVQEDYLGLFYLFGRLAYAPDGKRVFLCDGYRVLGIDLAEGAVASVVSGVHGFALSKDGTWLAGLMEGAVVFARADGRQTIYVRLEKDAAAMAWTPAWLGADAIAVLTEGGPVRVQRDGQIDAVPIDAGKEAQQLAVAPDGSRWVVVAGKVTWFKPDGKVVKELAVANEMLDRPTWRPDSKVVAFKRVAPVGEDSAEVKRATHIVFFDPDGKELSRVEIPPAGRRPARK